MIIKKRDQSNVKILQEEKNPNNPCFLTPSQIFKESLALTTNSNRPGRLWVNVLTIFTYLKIGNRLNLRYIKKNSSVYAETLQNYFS